MSKLKISGGRFVNKSDADRHVWSIRATDRIWDEFGQAAAKQKITRADLLEIWVTQKASNVEAIALLRHALTLKANAGGAIKQKIRSALALLEST
jgi:hypothetical protein